MPIYEYRCQDCKQIFEEWQADHEERELSCAVCGGTANRLISHTSFILKGSGWYATDYSSKKPEQDVAPAKADPGGGKPKAAFEPAPCKAPEDGAKDAAKPSATA